MNIPSGSNPGTSPDGNPLPPANAAEEDLQAQYRRLRMLVQATAVSVLIITGTVFVFLYRQVILVRRQTAELSHYLSEVERSGLADFMGRVRQEFNVYRKQHPDFNPIYSRYFGTNEPPPISSRVTPAPGSRSTNQ